VKAGGDRCVWV